MSECTPEERAMLDAFNRPGAIMVMPKHVQVIESQAGTIDRAMFEAACAAMTGLCVGLVGTLKIEGRSEISAYAHGPCNAALAERAVAAADALLAALARKDGGA